MLFCSQIEREESISSGTRSLYNDVVTLRIPQYRGAIVQSVGGTVIAEFRDAADAINCAIDIEERFGQHNRLHLDDGTIEAKIGIHFGEIFFSEGKCQGSGIDVVKALLSFVPLHKVYITRDVYLKVRLVLPLKFESVGKKTFASLSEPKEVLSVAWEAVTGNLEASLKRLSEEHLQQEQWFSLKLGSGLSKRASSLIIISVAVLIFLLFKVLKWL